MKYFKHLKSNWKVAFHSLSDFFEHLIHGLIPGIRWNHKQPVLCRNLKNDNIYRVLETDIINCTNANDGQKMVMYISMSNEDDMIFVREQSEFFMKFERVFKDA